MVILADSGARKLLHGAVARGVDADAAVDMSFGLDDPWQHIAGLLASLVRLLVLPSQAIGHGFEALWHAIECFFAGILAGLESVAHLLVLPFEAFWRWIQKAPAGISHSFDGMRLGIQSFSASVFAALAGAAHVLVHPLEAFWRWLQAAVTDAATGISIGFDGFWQHTTTDFFASFLAALAGLALELGQKLEAFWKWLKTAAAYAAAGISFSLDGLWALVWRVYAKLLAAVVRSAHDLVPRLESLWRWLRAAAAAALPVVLLIVAILCVVALVWYFWPFLCSVAVLFGQSLVKVALYGVVLLCSVAVLIGLVLVSAVAYFRVLLCSGAVLIGKALVIVVCYCERYLVVVALVVGKVLAFFLPGCRRWLAEATMRAPDAGNMVISRAAYQSLTPLYFVILDTAGPVVASAVFCSVTVAHASAPLVAALFRRPFPSPESLPVDQDLPIHVAGIADLFC